MDTDARANPNSYANTNTYARTYANPNARAYANPRNNGLSHGNLEWVQRYERASVAKQPNWHAVLYHNCPASRL